MKKIALTLTLFVFVALQLAAQNFRFGVQASPTFSWFNSSDKFLERSGSNTGIKLAMMAEKYFQRNYAIVSGIGFGFNAGGELQSGYDRYQPWVNSDLSVNIDDTDTDALPRNSKVRYHLRYIEVPVGLKMRGGSNEDSQLKFFAEAPIITFGFMSRALGDIRGAGGQFDTTDENIRDDVKGLALSWGFGGGIEYELATHTTLVGGIFYQNQFTDVSNNARARRIGSTDWADEKAKIQPRLLTLRLGIFF